MEKKQKIEVQGLPITIETVRKNDYVSMTGLAKHRGGDAKGIIKNWLRNGVTLHFIEAWEELHNPNFKREQMFPFYKDATDSARAPHHDATARSRNRCHRDRVETAALRRILTSR